MNAHTRMGLSFDRISFDGLKNLNKTWCDQLAQSYPTGSSTEHSQKDEIMDRAMAFTVVLMALLGSTLFGAGLVRQFVGRYTLYLPFLPGQYNLYPIMRILLHSTFVLFLPLQTYVLAHTQGQGQGQEREPTQGQGQGQERELGLMIMWMLLIELIRKKVLVMVLPADGSSFSRGIGRFTLMDYSDEVTRLLWVGYLIYSKIGARDHHRLVAMFVVLWSLSLVKLVQRVVSTWLASRSWLTARNPLLIAGYMQHVLDEEVEVNYSSAAASAAIDMTKCKYAVMGEEILVLDKEKRQTREKAPLKRATTHGYGYGVGRRVPCHPNEHEKQHVPYCDQNEQKHVHLLIDPKKMGTLVTVGDIWNLPSKCPKLFSDRRRQHLENLCLSFSLFKMLRRRFEHYPMVEVGSVMARKLMLKGVLTLEGDNPNDKAHRPFQVLQLELNFLENYYQDAAPVVMSQPILFFSNSALSMLFVLIYLAAFLAILIDDKDAAYLYCIAMGWASDLRKFRSLYPTITMLLVVTLIAIETTEFWTLYVFSEWNTVRLLCSYEQCGPLRRRIYYCLISARFWVSYVVRYLVKYFLRRRHADIKIKQVSIVNACGPFDKFSARVSQVTLAPKAKEAIVESLKNIDPNTGCISLPVLRLLPHMSGLGSCGKTSTEIIMAFHLATELFGIVPEVKCQKNLQDDDPKAVATALSRYCMYLVAHTPDLLPDDETWVSDRYEDMRSCLEHVSEQCCGTMCTPSHCCRKTTVDKILRKKEDLKDPTTRDGVKLFEQMKAESSEADVWKNLKEFWVQLLIYLVPSNDVRGHAKALASSGGDLITCLWAFCTHAGITRQPLEQHTAGDQNAWYLLPS